MKPKFKKGDKVKTIESLSNKEFTIVGGIVFTDAMVVLKATIRSETSVGTFTVEENPYYYSPKMLTKIK